MAICQRLRTAILLWLQALMENFTALSRLCPAPPPPALCCAHKPASSPSLRGLAELIQPLSEQPVRVDAVQL